MLELFNISFLLIIIMDPIGNLPIFVSILNTIDKKKRKCIFIREMLIALITMLIFLFAGQKILQILHLNIETVSISGGIILFLMSLNMIFKKKKEKKKKNDEPFLVPLAIPLVAGPSLLANLILLIHNNPNKYLILTISLLIAWSVNFFILSLSEFFLKILSTKGIKAVEQLMGFILIMISIQMFMNGLHDWLQL
ncbi:YhgN family NAAT transporter [Buchnera aphidicola (Mollitrichosiphum nigrofasciatum)]|uniref:YhgN family NAAT transporter n=1 Tax=Buchnera aphidicola TaxID=9 RepID=UPI0031B8A15E